MTRAMTIMLLAASACSPPTPPPTPPILASGFEEGVSLSSPERASGDWVQYLSGSDREGSWDSLPRRAAPRNRINYLVNAPELAPYAVSRIEPGTHFGRSLYMELRKQDPTTSTGTRVQFGIYPPDDFRQCYVRYWLYLQPNLASEILPPGTKRSRQVMEAKETGQPRADFRWSIYIMRDRNIEHLFWTTRAQFGDLSGSPVAWEETSFARVPTGDWILFEAFWKSGVEDGRVWAAVDGQTIVDFTGQTMVDSGLYVWWPFKLYTGSNLEAFGEHPLYQWIDDVEFRQERP